jgi:hypothetical protein
MPVLDHFDQALDDIDARLARPTQRLLMRLCS